MASSQQFVEQVQQKHQQLEQVLGGVKELTLSTPVEKLKVLCAFLVDFDNLKANGYD